MTDQERTSDLISTIKAFEHLTPQVHWFCPSQGVNDSSSNPLIKSEDPDIWRKDTHHFEKSHLARQRAFYECLDFYAYEGAEAVQFQDFLKKEVDRNLGRCDKCIVEYYKVKNRWIDQVEINETTDAAAFVTSKLNDIDISRIVHKLDNLALTLRDEDVEKHPARYGLLDALSCETFLGNDDLVRQHFDRPFKYLCVDALSSVSVFMPGTTIFLFDPNPSRRHWALSSWSGYSEMGREDDFNFAIRNPLIKVLQDTSVIGNDSKFLERFWVGIRVIVQKLDTNLITHSLRALEAPDVFRLSLEHLRYDKTGLRFILQAVSALLKIAPKDYWESMGAISPTAVVENIFNPHFTTILAETWDGRNPTESTINDLFDWIRPFVNSLETVHQSQTCRAISGQLMKKLQQASIPTDAKIECWRRGLSVIKFTLLNCNKEHPTFGPTGRVVAAETLDVVSQYIGRILTLPTVPEDDPWYGPCAALSLDIVELALTLECKSLRTDQETLRNSREMDPGTCSYGPAIWDKLVQQLVDTNVDLARTALSGINGLTGLEKFVTVKDEINRSYKSDFNVKFSHLTHLVCQMLERINDFDPVDLDRLFRKPTTATALVASLFSPDASTYEAGVNLMKTISSESVRQEAIRHVILSFFDVTLDAMSRSLRRIAHTRVYASCPRMLKTCKDVLDILCDSQSGLLRSRTLQGSTEAKSVENFWQHLWEILKVIYEMTDAWSKAHVADTENMKEFVRDTMDFSERLLDEYSIIASAIDSAISIKKEEGHENGETTIVAKRLLDPPAKTMEVIVRWLRLRDLYLVGKSVNLTKKLLNRLSEKKMVLAKDPSDFVELVIRGGPQGRTNLTPQEKAELARALEANIGRPIAPIVTEIEHSPAPDHQDKRSQSAVTTKKEKDGTIDFEAWRSKSKPSAQIIDIATEDEFGDSDIPDADLMSASRLAEGLKKLPKDKPPARSKPLSAAFTKFEAKDAGQKLAQQTAFAEKRKKELEAKKKRDAEVVAMQRKKVGVAPGSLGIQGKDHAPKQTGVMVSSGSESDSDDDVDRELFGSLKKAPKISGGVVDIHNDRLKQLKEKGPVKKTKQIRSAKDMRARLAPDLTSLHKTILGWEFFNAGEFPPGSGRDNYTLVSNTFRDPRSYQDVFEPLLALEGWQGFLKSREEGSAKVFEIKIANRLTVDSFVEVGTTMTLNEGKELGISEADIVLMSKGHSPVMETQQPHCLARVFKISRKKGNMETTYRVNVGNTLLPSMTPNATLHGVKIFSLTPLEREYGALLGLKYFDLCDEIIRAKPSPILQYSEKQLDILGAKYKINPAQAKAVRSAIDNDAFTLIQGPPGSGKTKTIVAIVGALLTGQFDEKATVIARPSVNSHNASTSSVSSSTSKKLLVCAPSNAAVDELVMRFKEGVKSLDGTFHRPSVVRLGRSDAINTKVVDVTLEELVNVKLNIASGKNPNVGQDIQQLMLAHKSTCDEFNTHRATMDALKASGKAVTSEQERTFEVLKRKKQQLSNQIDSARDSGAMVARDAEITRRKIQQEILEGAHVICATLSGSGHDMFQSLNIEFETVVIDEAAQSIELSALIPLKYGCSKCILVGDPKQLPPTVLSREAARFQYEQSLFVRMQKNHPNDVHLLDTQYRMHPEISIFPSKAFYDGRLLDGKDMAALRARPWHQSDILGPYRFFDVQGTQQSATRGHSLVNIAEIDMAMKLFARLTTDCRGYEFTGKVGIITPYKSQLRELRSRFAERYGDTIFDTIEFNTTDAFQGRESEVIIFSCVRASVGKGIGFVSDIRRMNVGITRAKSSLWVLGNSQSLMQGEFWAKLINDAKNRGRYSGSEVLELLQTPLVKMDPNFVSKRKNSSQSIVSRTASDVEMADAPSLNDSSLLQASRPATGFSGSAEAANSKPDGYIPSGGFNGLNTNLSCAVCGSTSHYTFMCGNTAAKASSRGRCYRCGSLDHEKERCTTERCIECGDFGHTQQYCTNPLTLTKSEKDRLKMFESDHRRFLQKIPEKQRRRQLGDHDKAVPVVLSTLDMPPPIEPKKTPQQPQQISRKRTREPSPPANAPKGPRVLSNGGSYRAKVHNAQQVGPKDTPSRPAGQPNPPLRSPTLSSGRSSEFSGRIPNQSLDRSAVSPTNSLPPPRPREKLDHSATTAGRDTNLQGGPGKSDANPPSMSSSSFPKRPPIPNVKPPAKKKKEVNPFLIPNKKRR